MHLVSYKSQDGHGFGRLEGDVIVELGASFKEYLGEEGKAPVQLVNELSVHEGKRRRFSDVSLQSPVPNPAKIICVSDNYAEHIREFGGEVDHLTAVTPQLFLKPPTTTLLASGQPLRLPVVSQVVDWEVELAVVIGRRGKYILESDVDAYIAGYTILNDISDRELAIWPKERRTEREWDPFFDWFAGKCMDGFAPVGPALVTADEVLDPMNLPISLKLNGRCMQDSNTGRMMTSVKTLVSYISSVMTLEPGDLIATGTPSGVGTPRGERLKPGDVIEAEIEGFGILRTPVEAEQADVSKRPTAKPLDRGGDQVNSSAS